MKKITLLLLVSLVLSSCKDKIYKKYLAYVPVYEDYVTFRNSIVFEGPKTITKQAGIYQKDAYLFIVEENEGVHFINNSQPSSPIKMGFLKVSGCTGMAIKDNYLYVNQRIDVAVIDISNINQPKVAAREEDLFPAILPENEGKYPMAKIDKSRGVVVGWEVKETKEEVSNSPTWNNCPTCETASINNFTSGGGGISSGVGKSGSITKFAIAGNYLYIMDGHLLHSLNISNPLNITHQNPVTDWRDVETLFPYNGHLFMGTTTGMRIYSLANPSTPTFVSTITHALACDPVVVQGNYAYVTIRSGTLCNGATVNQLDIIDLTTIANPVLKKTFQLNNPHGLGIDGNLLFICDGSEGLKIYDATNPVTSGDNLIKQFANIQATDVIPNNGIAILIGEQGLYQYDYTNPNAIQLISTIQFN